MNRAELMEDTWSLRKCERCGRGPFRGKLGLSVHQNHCDDPDPFPNRFRFADDRLRIDVSFNLGFIVDAPRDTVEALFHLADLVKRDSTCSAERA